jgi:hypothetical protein
MIIAPREDHEQIARESAPFGERLAWRIAHSGAHVREDLTQSSERVQG